MRLNFPPGWRTERSGFTLIELVIGLALWVVVTVSLTSVFRSGLRLWKSAETNAPHEEEARAILGQIAREFRNAMDVPGLEWSTDNGKVIFATLEDGKIRKVTYHLASDSALHRSLEDLGADGTHEEIDTPLTEGPAAIAWRYAYDSPNGLTWQSDWRPSVQNGMPCGVQVQLTLYNGKGEPDVYSRTMFTPLTRAMPWTS
jgi:prepilin-type N-terminal cleavage/methylation domain-containing protein